MPQVKSHYTFAKETKNMRKFDEVKDPSRNYVVTRDIYITKEALADLGDPTNIVITFEKDQNE